MYKNITFPKCYVMCYKLISKLVDLLIFEISLVTDQVEKNIWVGVLLSLLQPVNNVQEGVISKYGRKENYLVTS